VRSSKPSDVDHCAAKGGLDNAIAHADDEEQEEGERVSGRIEDRNDDEVDLTPDIGRSVMILVICATVSMLRACRAICIDFRIP
jgi:hypothetical protein